MSFKNNIQYRFPPEGAMQLYRGLVRDGEKLSRKKTINSSSCNADLYERERMRVLEILGLLDNKTDKNSFSSSFPSRIKTVDKPSHHLGSNARKRQKIQRGKLSSFKECNNKQLSSGPKSNTRLTTCNNDSKLKQIENLRKIYESTERKKSKEDKATKESKKTYQKSKICKPTRFNPILSKDYVWHPITVHDSGICQSNKEAHKKKQRSTEDILRYYHNQYHKQNTK